MKHDGHKRRSDLVLMAGVKRTLQSKLPIYSQFSGVGLTQQIQHCFLPGEVQVGYFRDPGTKHCCCSCRQYHAHCVFTLTGCEKCSDDTMRGSHYFALVGSISCWGAWGGTLRTMIRDVDVFRAEKMMSQLNVWITKVWKHCKASILNNLFQSCKQC